jgi:hypothetical protein
MKLNTIASLRTYYLTVTVLIYEVWSSKPAFATTTTRAEGAEAAAATALQIQLLKMRHGVKNDRKSY